MYTDFRGYICGCGQPSNLVNRYYETRLYSVNNLCNNVCCPNTCVYNEYWPLIWLLLIVILYWSILRVPVDSLTCEPAVDDYGIISRLTTATVKPVFKGHCDEGTPCDQGTLSEWCPIFPMLKNLWWRDTCHIGTLSLGYRCPLKTGFTVISRLAVLLWFMR